jgi:hypothetical protein
MNEKPKPIKLKATVMWCFHNKINEMATKYTIDLCNLSDNAVKALEEFGINVMKREDKPEKGFFITCKSNNPLEIFDSSGKDLKDIAIGNGSTVTAVVSKYPWKYKNREGWSPSLVKGVVDSLVAYNATVVAEEALDEEVL